MISGRKHLLRNALLLSALLLLFTEGAMRLVFAVKKYPIGSIAPAWMAFSRVDSLIVQQSCFTDESGLYKLKKDFWLPLGHSINAENFRSREFTISSADTSAVSLLFIGDSFVWGAQAEPINSCFVDLLGKDEHFICFNAGVPGTDPAQYAAVAERYVPLLHPGFTLVVIYLGNDLMKKKRELVPNEEQWFQTNAGWLPAAYKGRRFATAQESYDYVINKYTPKNFLQKALLKTATGTAILSLPCRTEEYAEWEKKKRSPVTNNYLREIKSVCEKNGSRLLVFIIPALQTDLTADFFKNPEKYVLAQYPALMNGIEGLTYVLPVKKEFYRPLPNGHLNNAGHKAAAEFIRAKIISAVRP